MVETEQLVRWLNDSGEAEAAKLSKSCSLNWIWVTLASELGGDRDWDIWDVNIEAPATILKLVRANGSAVGKTIEEAIRELAEAGGRSSLRDARWVPKPATAQTSSEPEITEVTRREIVDRLGHRDWAGRLQEDDFLSRLYDLNALPSEDKRFQTAAGDIWQHRVNNNDGEGDWVFYDRRFNLLRGADQDFLRFLCETVHPVVRPDADEALELVGQYNEQLRSDGWELVRSVEISGHPVFRAQQTTREAEIFDEPTGWPRVDRQTGELRLRLREASTEEQFQSVGHLCREALISVAQAVYDRRLYPPLDGIEPSSTDAKRMLDAYLSVELAGGDHAAARKHAKAAFDLANELQHKRTAIFRDAALCAEAALSVIRIVAIVSGRRERAGLD
jgi:hypothetical protein